MTFGSRSLSPEDLSILALENETVAGHTCKVIVLADQVEPDRLRAAIAARLRHAPQLCTCLGERNGEPCWMLGEQPDLDRHVVVHVAGSPLEGGELRSAVAALFEQRLDRSRPLWRIDLIPEVAGAGSALVWRVHHALADGVTTMRIAEAVLWDESPPRGPSAPTSRAPAPGAPRRHRLAALRAASREAPQPWRRSPFDGRISAQRVVAFVSVELGEMRRVARAHARATINDAVLTVVAGGLRRWLESQHGRLGSVRVKVPVSLHGSPETDAEQGNRDSFFCLDLPLGSADPLERMAAIQHATKVRKQDHDAQQLDALMRQLGRAPRLRQFAERVMAHPRSFALNVSNVPGPRQPVHVLGSRVLAIYSLAEIREHHALRVAVASVGDTLNFGLVADPTLMADVEHLARMMRAEADDLVSRVRPV